MAPLTYLLLLVIMLASNNFPCSGTHLENSTMASLDGERVNPTTIMKSPSGSAQKVVNVQYYGAKGDEDSDSMAFEKAWKKACSSSTPTILLIPKNKRYLLKPMNFRGPCKSRVSFTIMGTLEASRNQKNWDGRISRHWILFSNIDNLTVRGGGTINGNGKIWWRDSCKMDASTSCVSAPTALSFNSCKNLRVENLKVMDSPRMHISLEKCTGVDASHLTITAPHESPNTDGIHITHSKNVKIANSFIGTGDDCISIVSGSKNVMATNIVCGPGHGISIGSLGAHNSEAQVSNVTVDTARFIETANGVRIKTWQGGKGYAKGLTFKNIVMHNVLNPIIIDQNYCDSQNPCQRQVSAVQVMDVLYQNIKGTSASEVAINLQCSNDRPCRHVLLQDVNLVGVGGDSAKSLCSNVQWIKRGTVIPPPRVHD
ncbi:hypothetical protein C4D60_Mb10t19740 [Musa balbisiana]|uniref:endo-polygalacturonase n=1 Tax=Musa balbisiana TaxID=52838 RepID=A0A4S8IZT1_MUSBA|nr:hypothetical protein C4D60_Mb10t19740 [Musa balbisiana]